MKFDAYAPTITVARYTGILQELADGRFHATLRMRTDKGVVKWFFNELIFINFNFIKRFSSHARCSSRQSSAQYTVICREWLAVRSSAANRVPLVESRLRVVLLVNLVYMIDSCVNFEDCLPNIILTIKHKTYQTNQTMLVYRSFHLFYMHL